MKVSASYARFEKVEISSRICLWCGWWMRSTCPAHRKCNFCKRDLGGSPMRVGNRIRPFEGVKQETLAWKLSKVEEEFPGFGSDLPYEERKIA